MFSRWNRSRVLTPVTALQVAHNFSSLNSRTWARSTHDIDSNISVRLDWTLYHHKKTAWFPRNRRSRTGTDCQELEEKHKSSRASQLKCNNKVFVIKACCVYTLIHVVISCISMQMCNLPTKSRRRKRRSRNVLYYRPRKNSDRVNEARSHTHLFSSF